MDFEKYYKDLLINVLENGTKEKNRTGVDTIMLPNQELKFISKNNNIPLITGKKIFYKKAAAEFEWIFNGFTNIKFLNEHDIYWWNEYADENGELGKTYGYQFRNYNGNFDQLKYVVDEINIGSRRAYISFWNPSELNQTSLPCCYTGMKFTLNNSSETLNASLYFRSSDLFMGLPYDFIFGYKMLKSVADLTNKQIGEISYVLADAHIYENHIKQCLRYIKSEHYILPTEEEAKSNSYISGPHIKIKLNN